jgi:hypothetical protein
MGFAYALTFILVAVSVVYTTIAQRNTEEKFCNIVTTVNQAYKDSPEPNTELGRKIKVQYAQLERDLKCKT